MTDIEKQPLPEDLSDCILAETRTIFTIAQLSENLSAIGHLLQQSQNSIDIFSHLLDHRIFDQGAVLDAIRNLVVGSTRASVRILVSEPQFMISHGHRIIELARRLSSHIEIRKTHQHYAHTRHMFVIADQRGYVYKESDERYEGLVNFNDPAKCREWRTTFNEAWEHSQAISDFRRLHI